jgi:hypothetical protein
MLLPILREQEKHVLFSFYDLLPLAAAQLGVFPWRKKRPPQGGHDRCCGDGASLWLAITRFNAGDADKPRHLGSAALDRHPDLGEVAR